MPLFKKAKKKTPEQKFYEWLMEEITFAATKGKYAIYVPIKDTEEDWLYRFTESRGYVARASHNTEGVAYYKLYGWECGNENF